MRGGWREGGDGGPGVAVGGLLFGGLVRCVRCGRLFDGAGSIRYRESVCCVWLFGAKARALLDGDIPGRASVYSVFMSGGANRVPWVRDDGVDHGDSVEGQPRPDSRGARAADALLLAAPLTARAIEYGLGAVDQHGESRGDHGGP